MSNCIFCKIIRSEIPAYKVYEDERLLAILDHRPVREGHVMILPKAHVDHFIDLKPDVAQHIMAVAQKLALKISSTLKPPRVGFLVSGFGVSHAHFHVQPLWDEHDITSARYLDASKQPPVFNPMLIDVASPERQKAICDLLFIENEK